MSQGIVRGSDGYLNLNAGSHILPISTVVNTFGVTQVVNGFQVAALGSINCRLSIQLTGNSISLPVRVQVWNSTLGVEAVGQDVEAPGAGEGGQGNHITIPMPFVVSDSTHVYQIRVIVTINPPARLTVYPRWWAELASAAAELSIRVVPASGTTQTLNPVVANVQNITMDANCAFTLAAPQTVFGRVTLMLRGAFNPTFPGVQWPLGAIPGYASPSIYSFVTFDGGTTWQGMIAGAAFA
jgi:hypothetical protein